MKRGFTLIELLIVIAIIAILALIAVPNFLEAQTRAKVSRVKGNMRSLATAIEAYFLDYNAYPHARTWQDLNAGQINGYREYCNYLVTFNIFANSRMSTLVLTTPVAYITSFPEDPFLINSATRTNAGASNERNVSYLYFNIHGAFGQVTRDASNWGNPDPPHFKGYSEQFRFNGREGKESAVSWGLVSPGPSHLVAYDKVWGSGTAFIDKRVLLKEANVNSFRMGQVATYDPTNGTVSVGGIFRLSSGGVE